MPQPYKGGFIGGPNVMREHPALAAEIGNIASNWSWVEHSLMMLYGLLMGTYLPRPSGLPADGTQWGAPIHPVAHQIFDGLQTLNVRLDLLTRLVKWCAEPSEAEHFEKVLVKKIRKVAKARNEILHGLWYRALATDELGDGEPIDIPDVLILKSTFGPSLQYKLADFEDISARILGVRRELSAFTHPISNRISQKLNEPSKS